MPPQKRQRTWIIIGVIVSAILILAIGILIIKTLTTGDFDDSSVDEPRNPPATGAVVIQSFTLEPARIQVGECTNLSWSVNNAEIVTLSRNDELIYVALFFDEGYYFFDIDEASDRYGFAIFIEEVGYCVAEWM